MAKKPTAPLAIRFTPDERDTIKKAHRIAGSPSPHAFMRETVLRRARAVVRKDARAKAPGQPAAA